MRNDSARGLGRRVDYKGFLNNTAENRRGAFLTAAQELRTAPRNVEKDFWICVVLDAVFMESTRRWPRMAFRGGTSLSKAFDVINRFSEDIDIAIERADLGLKDTLAALEALSPDRLAQRLAAFNASGETFVARTVAPHLDAAFDRLFQGRIEERPFVAIHDDDRLTLDIGYRSVLAAEDDYIQHVVRLEFSVRSALKPQSARTIEPYVARVTRGADMTIPNVPTLAPRRTFWDKILIAHTLKRRRASGAPLTLHNERVSRHYYDLWMLL